MVFLALAPVETQDCQSAGLIQTRNSSSGKEVEVDNPTSHTAVQAVALVAVAYHPIYHHCQEEAMKLPHHQNFHHPQQINPGDQHTSQDYSTHMRKD
jgi:hypothetical protein